MPTTSARSIGSIRAAWHSAPSLDGVDIVVIRLLGGIDAWPDGFRALAAACTARAIPLVAAGGEAVPDPDLVAASSVPTGVAAQAHAYLAAGGPGNVANLLRFLSDTLLLSGAAFDPPAPVADVAIWPGAGLGREGAVRDPSRPLIAVVFYRAHLVAGNTTYVAALCAALEAAGADAAADLDLLVATQRRR